MLMVCHHLDPQDRRGRRLRRIPHPPRDHRRRGHPARPRRVLDDVVRLPGDGPRRRGHHPHLADRAQDEAPARRARRTRPATTTTSASSATSPSTRSIPRSRTASRTSRLGRGRQARRPRAVEAGVLRREARAGPQRRHDRRGADGRPQRLDPDAAAGALPADVRRLRPRARVSVGDLRQQAAVDAGLGERLGLAQPLLAVANTRGGIGKRNMMHNDAHAEDRGRSRDLRGARRRRAADLRAGEGAADGAALFPVLS